MMLPSWHPLSLLIWLATAAAASALPETSDRDFARGVRLQQQGDLAGARAAYEAALRSDARRIDVLSNLGLVYAGLHDYTRALETFQAALKLAPGQLIVLFNLGVTALEAGRYQEAREALAQVVAGDGSNQQARHFLALALLKQGRLDAGILELERVIAAQPENLDVVYTLCSAYLRTAQLKRAKQLIDGRLAGQDTAEAHMLRGSYQLAARNYAEAIAELRRAQQLNPALPDVGSRLGEGHALAGSRDTAIQVFEEQLMKNPSDFEALAFLGWLYLESDRPGDARSVLERARRIRPEDPDVLFHIARLAQREERDDEVLALLERVVSLRPGYTQAHVLLAQVYFRLNRTADGERESEIVKRLREQDRVRLIESTTLPGAPR
jgi:tetratricopeptide (TPR) repeat protein